MRKSKTKKNTLLDCLYLDRDKALDRVVRICLTDRDPDELNKALDVLTVAHARATFEFASGSFSS
jgi:hypothetical protein